MLSMRDNFDSSHLLSHSSSSSFENIGYGWKTFFKNEDTINCPIDKCKLLNGSLCNSTYSGDLIQISNV